MRLIIQIVANLDQLIAYAREVQAEGLLRRLLRSRRNALRFLRSVS